MPSHWYKRLLTVVALAAFAGCDSPTAPDELVVTGAPDLTAVVTHATYESGMTPAGYMSQYDLWISTSPARTSDAGVVVGSSTPVFIRINGQLHRASSASFKVGDAVQVWHDGTVGYGAVESPPGKPCYVSTQVVIE